MVNPPSACPGCLALAGQPWPENTTSAYCRRCAAHLQRLIQFRRWQRPYMHLGQADPASYPAFAARWRAQQGLPPFDAASARRFLSPDNADDIRGPMGMLLPARIRQAVWRAWCAGELVGVAAWVSMEPAPSADALEPLDADIE